MRRHLAIGLTVLALGCAALTGCSDAKDAVNSAAGGLATSAASKAASAAQSVVRQQICTIASDGQISASESETLKTVVANAKSAGVPTAITDPAERIASSGANPPQDAVNAVRTECAKVS